jgi:LuxR family maltose regulon positive regulatory protein
MRLALIEGLAVQALLNEGRGQPDIAAQLLRESLEMAAPEGIIQRYAYLGPELAPILRRLLNGTSPVPHARSVLTSLETVNTAQPPGPAPIHVSDDDLVANPLTDREREVIRLLALRLTNNEIGEDLFISPITVKHHVANIAGKLGVAGRRAAVDRARELGLVT